MIVDIVIPSLEKIKCFWYFIEKRQEFINFRIF